MECSVGSNKLSEEHSSFKNIVQSAILLGCGIEIEVTV